MDVVILIAFIFVLVARRNAVYHSDMLFKKYINLENKKFKRLFIPKRSKVYKTVGAEETDRNKMNILPLILAVISIIFVIGLIIAEVLKAKELGQVGFYFTTDALFKLIMFFVGMICLSSAILLINTFKCFGRKTAKQIIGTVIRILLTVIFIILFIVCMGIVAVVI